MWPSDKIEFETPGLNDLDNSYTYFVSIAADAAFCVLLAFLTSVQHMHINVATLD